MKKINSVTDNYFINSFVFFFVFLHEAKCLQIGVFELSTWIRNLWLEIIKS